MKKNKIVYVQRNRYKERKLLHLSNGVRLFHFTTTGEIKAFACAIRMNILTAVIFSDFNQNAHFPLMN